MKISQVITILIFIIIIMMMMIITIIIFISSILQILFRTITMQNLDFLA